MARSDVAIDIDSASTAASGEDELEQRARRLSAQFGGSSALDILHEAINVQFPGRIAMVSSFGAESASLLHLVAQVNPQTPVLFLETGKHFAQTISYRKKLARDLGLTNVQDLKPDANVLEEQDPKGELWRHDTDACCTIRKVAPLAKALEGFDAWITGRKHFHGGGRARLPIFEAASGQVKVNPIARWNQDDLNAYIEAHQLPPHPLVAQGYPSIGCWPCTHPSDAEGDPRSGRWRGQAKTECGIHMIGAQKKETETASR